MNENKSPQNRYCCVPLCNKKGTTGPNGEKVGFFSIPTDTSFRAQWLHAIRRDTGKHFTITDSTKVCSLHFKNEHLKKSLGIGRLSYVDVMCRLRQGFPERHLGHLFDISQSTVSRIVISWVNFMYLRFGQLNIWPSQKVVNDNMPQDFKGKYPNTRVQLRCLLRML